MENYLILHFYLLENDLFVEKDNNDNVVGFTQIVDHDIFRENGTTSISNPCPICLEELKESLQYILPCIHRYHKHCLDLFVSFGNVCCPICNVQLNFKKKNNHKILYIYNK
jgi:hypothetical protein